VRWWCPKQPPIKAHRHTHNSHSKVTIDWARNNNSSKNENRNV